MPSRRQSHQPDFKELLFAQSSLNWRDIGGTNASVISEAAARKLFPGRDPLGATFTNGRGVQFIVVGIVGNVRNSLEQENRENESPVYVIPGKATRSLRLIIRTKFRQETLLHDIQREVSALAPGTPVAVQWWADSVGNLTAYRNPRFQTLILGSFAGLAMVLTALGIFAVIAFSVTSRTHEIGIRVALGATPHLIMMRMIMSVMIPVAIGTLGSIVVIHLMRRIIETQFFKIETYNPSTFIVAAVSIVIISIVAAIIPTLRVRHIDPIAVLREK